MVEDEGANLREVSDLAFKARRMVEGKCWKCTEGVPMSPLGLCEECREGMVVL